MNIPDHPPQHSCGNLQSRTASLIELVTSYTKCPRCGRYIHSVNYTIDEPTIRCFAQTDNECVHTAANESTGSANVCDGHVCSIWLNRLYKTSETLVYISHQNRTHPSTCTEQQTDRLTDLSTNQPNTTTTKQTKQLTNQATKSTIKTSQTNQSTNQPTKSNQTYQTTKTNQIKPN
jgi:hypothetical protein